MFSVGRSQVRVGVALCVLMLSMGACSDNSERAAQAADHKRALTAEGESNTADKGRAPPTPSVDTRSPEAEFTPTSEQLVLSIPVGSEKGVHYEDVGIENARAEGPSAVRRADDGTIWVADTVRDRLLRFSAAGVLDVKITLAPDQVAASDVWGDAQGVTTLDLSATEPALVRYDLDGKVGGRTRLPSAHVHDVSGFWDAGEVLPWLDLGEKGVLAVAPGPTLSFASAAVPHQHAGFSASLEVNLATSKTLRVTTKDGSFEPIPPKSFVGARLVYADAKHVFVEAQASDEQVGIARYLMRVRVAERQMQCARIDAGAPFVTIGHDLSIARDGQAYAARAHAQRVDVVRLGWSRRCDTP